MGILFDESAFPLVAVSFDGTSTDAEIDALIGLFDRCTARSLRTRRRVAFVFDARKAHVVTAAQRRRVGEWMMQNDASSRATCAGFAFVIPSAIVRGALTAILWIAPMPAPHRVVADIGEGLAFAREQLGTATPVGLDIAV
jgi:hypothetical protein